MCSILAILDIDGDVTSLRSRALQLFAIRRQRGPDGSGAWDDERAVLAHERLGSFARLLNLCTGPLPR